MPFSVRLDSRTEQLVRRVARQSNRTRSDLVREAIAAYAREQEHGPAGRRSAYERVAHLIGAADSGGSRRSEATGDRFRALLREKARARRAG
jgi:predicted DNA-binding protein